MNPDEKKVTLREYLEARIDANHKLHDAELVSLAEALRIARVELERRLEGLNELRAEVVRDRGQFLKIDIYGPAHEELRRQRVVDNERLIVITADVKNNATDIAAMKNSQTWLIRLVAGAIVLALIAYAFQRMTT